MSIPEQEPKPWAEMKQMIGLALCRNSPLAGSLFYPLLVCHNPIWWHQGWPVICFHFRRFDFTEAPFQDTKCCFRVCRHVPKRESCSQAESSSSWVPWTEKLRLKKKGWICNKTMQNNHKTQRIPPFSVLSLFSMTRRSLAQLWNKTLERTRNRATMVRQISGDLPRWYTHREGRHWIGAVYLSPLDV